VLPAERYRTSIRQLSDELVALQRPIRILNSIQWPRQTMDAFVASDFKTPPRLTPESYAHIDLGFEPRTKRREFEELETKVLLQLGESDPAGAILLESCREYETVVELLEKRGTPEFGAVSKRLFGSSRDLFFDKSTNVRELGVLMGEILDGILPEHLGVEFPKVYTAEYCAAELNRRFQDYFHADVVVAELSDAMVADAAAGADRVKLRPDAMFSSRDIDILEVHEAWVHVGTTLNGGRQPWCTWLSKGSPRVTATQEGLAVMMEIFTFRSYPVRAQRINDRVLGISWAEEGAGPCEVAQEFLARGHSVDDVRYNVGRIFRGTDGQGGAPFTKDLAYARGFIENYNFIRTAVGTGHMYMVPLMFCGKLALRDIPALYQLQQDGVLAAPAYLPPQFADLNGLAVWMGFSNFFNRVRLETVKEHYMKMFKSIPTSPGRVTP
jgi:uncharacterized protein (TIGR02421 family)